MSALRIGFRFASLFQFANMMRELLLLLPWKWKKKKNNNGCATGLFRRMYLLGKQLHKQATNLTKLSWAAPQLLHKASNLHAFFAKYLFPCVLWYFFFSKKKSNEFLQYFVRFFIFKMKVFQPKKDWIFSFQTKKLF